MIYKFECEDDFGTTLEVGVINSKINKETNVRTKVISLDMKNQDGGITLRLGLIESYNLRKAIDSCIDELRESNGERIKVTIPYQVDGNERRNDALF